MSKYDFMDDHYFPTVDTLYNETEPDADMLSNRKQTLEVKLAVLAQNLQTRMNLYQKTASSLESAILEALQPVEHLTNSRSYGLPYAREELLAARQELNSMNSELRSRDSECWKDVSMIMREILVTWEELQAAIAREAMMHDE
jgi:hypothetical protein